MIGYVAKHDWPKIFINRIFGVEFWVFQIIQSQVYAILRSVKVKSVFLRENERFCKKNEENR